MIQNLRYAIRFILRRPKLSLTAVLLTGVVMALAGTAFRLPWIVLYSRLPYDRPEGLMFLWQQPRSMVAPARGIVAPGVLSDWIERQQVFSELAAAETWVGNKTAWIDFQAAPDSYTQRLRGALVTPNFFRILGIRPALGSLVPEAAGTNSGIVISYDLWRRNFGGEPDAVGRSVQVAFGRRRVSMTLRILGVLPEGVQYTYPVSTDVWLSLSWESVRRAPADSVMYDVIGRLKDGVSVEAAASGMRAVADSSPADLAWFSKQETVRLESMADFVVGDSRHALNLVAAAALALLLVGGLNTTTYVRLLTDRGHRDTAIRVALGAQRRLLVSGTVFQVVAIVAAASAMALVMSAPILYLLRESLTDVMPRAREIISLDWGFVTVVTGFIATIAGLTVLLGLRFDLRATALLSSKALNPALPSRGAARASVVAAQVAIAYVLGVTATILALSSLRLDAVQLGFDPSDLYVAETRLIAPKYFANSKAGLKDFRRRVVALLRERPGVLQVTTSSAIPFRGTDWLWAVQDVATARRLAANARQVDLEFLDMMKIPLLSGRMFTQADTGDRVAVVSESFAKQLDSTGSVIGRLIQADREYRVVGVVGDVRYASPAASPQPALYVPVEESESEIICLILRTTLRNHMIDATVREAVSIVDSSQPVDETTPLARVVTQANQSQRVVTMISFALAVTAGLLALTAIYGAATKRVAERRNELAVRIAMGASLADARLAVIRRESLPVLCGVLLGAVITRAWIPSAEPVLYQVNATNPLFLVAGALAVLLTAGGVILIATRTLERLDLTNLLNAR